MVFMYWYRIFRHFALINYAFRKVSQSMREFGPSLAFLVNINKNKKYKRNCLLWDSPICCVTSVWGIVCCLPLNQLSCPCLLYGRGTGATYHASNCYEVRNETGPPNLQCSGCQYVEVSTLFSTLQLAATGYWDMGNGSVRIPRSSFAVVKKVGASFGAQFVSYSSRVPC